MQDTLTQLGLNEKEVKFYLYLLEQDALTAAQIAKELNESRTNTYQVLENLGEQGLVEFNDSSPVRKYAAADPNKLKNLVVNQQRQLKQTQVGLSGILPELISNYRLTKHKPGVVYLEGLEGYKTYQEDIARSSKIAIFASNVVPENKAAWEALQKAVKKRHARGTSARIIFHDDALSWLDIKAFEKNGYEVRFWGSTPLDGEIVIYDNKIATVVYQPSLIVTVLTNGTLAVTLQTIYDQIWLSAECP